MDIILTANLENKMRLNKLYHDLRAKETEENDILTLFQVRFVFFKKKQKECRRVTHVLSRRTVVVFSSTRNVKMYNMVYVIYFM